MADISLSQLPFDPVEAVNTPLLELTQSAMTTFMECPQKYVLKYLLRLKRRGINPAFVVGNAIHRAFEVMFDPYNPKSMDDRIHEALAAIDDEVATTYERSDEISPSAGEKMEYLRAQAHAMLRAWYTINGDQLATWKLAAFELTKRATASSLSDELEARLAGKIDGIIIDHQGKVWFVEHKTRSSLKYVNENGLELDTQSMVYVIIGLEIRRRLIAGNLDKSIVRRIRLDRHQHSTDKQSAAPDAEELQAVEGCALPLPHGFFYDCIQKPQHRMNKNGFDDLVERMYVAMCDDPTKYFSLTPVVVDQEMIDFHYSNLRIIVDRMDALRVGNVQRNTTACEKYGGCEFMPLCKARADVNNPAAIFDTPSIDLYDLANLHEELDTHVEED